MTCDNLLSNTRNHLGHVNNGTWKMDQIIVPVNNSQEWTNPLNHR